MVLLFASCGKNERYHIQGNLRCVNAHYAYLMEMNPIGQWEIIDSTAIRGGAFSFKGHVDFPTMRFIKIGNSRPFNVFVENNDIKISGSVLYPDDIVITGSNAQADLNLLTEKYKEVNNKRNSVLVKMTNAQKKGDKALIKNLKANYEQLPDSLLLITKNFVTSNPTSVGAAYFVCSLTETFNISKLEPIINQFHPAIGGSQYIKYLNDELILSQNFKEGATAPDFEIPTTEGETISLHDFQGKYLYLDFGASWCKETDGRNEALRDIYQQYHAKGLEILSISLDTNEEQWHEFACKTPELPWKQACDLLYWASPVTKRYRVNKIPYGILIDPEGTIVKIDKERLTLGDILRKRLDK
ncbi:MAG: AhpC/TSA family protein [Paludibacteraceae bacterium]|nr:AhpC/TSA family protein [Paludibacteraceae bacterium]